MLLPLFLSHSSVLCSLHAAEMHVIHKFISTAHLILMRKGQSNEGYRVLILLAFKL